MRKAFIQLHLAVFLAGFTAVLGKMLEMNEALLVTYRLIISVLSLFILLKITGKFYIPGRVLSFKMLGVGALVAFHWLCFYGSVNYGNISIALVCLSTMSFFTALLEPLFMRRRIDWIELMLGILTMIGIYIIFNFNPHFKKGIAFGIVAAFGSSIFPILNKQLVDKVRPRTLTLFELTGGLVFMGIILPFYLKFFPSDTMVPDGRQWLLLAVLAWFCTLLPFELQLNALQKISAFTSNLTYNLEPLYGIIMGFVFFNEAAYFHKGFYYGMALILVTVILHTWRVLHIHKNKKSEFQSA